MGAVTEIEITMMIGTIRHRETETVGIAKTEDQKAEEGEKRVGAVDF